MIGFIIKCALALISLFSTIALFGSGHWGWGIVMIFVTIIISLFFLRHERMILALNQMRVGNHEKAAIHMNKITHPQFLNRTR